MTIPSSNDLVYYNNKPLDNNDWESNFNQIISWITSGTYDFTLNSLNVSDINISGTLSFSGDIATTKIKAFDANGLSITDQYSNLGVFVQDTTGYVGIGHNNPASLFHIESSATVSGNDVNIFRDIGDGEYNSIVFGESYNTHRSAIIGYVYKTTATDSYAFFGLLGDSYALDKSIIIKAGGNVGIGTPTPSTKLEVVGGTKLDGAVTITGSILSPLKVVDATSSYNCQIETSSQWGMLFTQVNSASESNFGFISASSVELMRLSASTGTRIRQALNIIDVTGNYNSSIQTSNDFGQLYQHVNAAGNADFAWYYGIIELARLTQTGFYTSTPNITAVNAISVNAQGLFGIATSSIRYKENIQNLDIDIEDIYALNPVSFDWKELQELKDGSKIKMSDFGFIAEEVYKHVPEIVRIENDIIEGVRYEKLPIIQQLVLRHQKTEIESLKKLVSELTDRIIALEAK